MSIVAFVISLALLIFSFINKKKSKSLNPIILFYGLWTFILFLSMLQLYGIYKPSNEAYFLIILMLVFFFLGSITNLNALKLKIQHLLKKNNKDNSEDEIIKSNNQEEKNMICKFGKTIFYILTILLIIFYIIDCVIVVQGVLDGVPIWQIRRWGMEPVGSGKTNPLIARRTFIEEAFRSIVLAPFATLIPPIAAYIFFNSKTKKEKYKFLIISVLVLLLSSIAGGGGRMGFIYYFGCFLLGFLVVFKNNKISEENKKKYKKIVFSILAIGFLMVVLYTIIRTGRGNFIKQVYTYFALPPTLLSIWLPEIENVEHTYGLLTTFGIHSYFFRILETIGLNNLVPTIYNETYNHILNAEIFKSTGYGVGNAFVTPIYYFMIDGGYPFVCIASYVFGLIVSTLYKKFEEKINMKNFVIYALVVYGIFLTFMRIQTCIPSYIISFILAYLILDEKINDVILGNFNNIVSKIAKYGRKNNEKI